MNRLRLRLRNRRVYNRYHTTVERVRDRLIKERIRKPIAQFVFSQYCRVLCLEDADYRAWIKHMHAQRRQGIL